VAHDHGLLLPWVDIPRDQRLAESLTTAMRMEWSCENDLSIHPRTFHPRQAARAEFAIQVMECCDKTHDLRTKWVLVSSLLPGDFAKVADYAAVVQSVWSALPTSAERRQDHSPESGGSHSCESGWRKWSHLWGFISVVGFVSSMPLHASASFDLRPTVLPFGLKRSASPISESSLLRSRWQNFSRSTFRRFWIRAPRGTAGSPRKSRAQISICISARQPMPPASSCC